MQSKTSFFNKALFRVNLTRFSPLWILYDIMVGSWAGILDEIVTEASMIISIIRYGWKALDRVED